MTDLHGQGQPASLQWLRGSLSGANLARLDASTLLIAAWTISIVATLTALFIGEVLGQTPCVLCWFQRIFMFPLPIILGVACVLDDRQVWRYALPCAAIGGAIAAYHSLLYLGLVPESLEPCSATKACSGANMLILKTVPIPFLALGSFALIAALLLAIRRSTAS